MHLAVLGSWESLGLLHEPYLRLFCANLFLAYQISITYALIQYLRSQSGAGLGYGLAHELAMEEAV